VLSRLVGSNPTLSALSLFCRQNVKVREAKREVPN
jgi:hypothetical protein